MVPRGSAFLSCLLAATSPSAASGFLLRQPSVVPTTADAATVPSTPSRRRLDSRSRARTRPSSRSPAALAAASPGAVQKPDDPERSRRDVLRAALAVPAGAFAISSSFSASKESSSAQIEAESSLSSNPAGLTKVTALPSVRAALDLIDKSCDRRFIHAVVASDYNFLYRGLPSGGVDARSPTIRMEPCDLLDPSTYGSDEAASYFRALDDRMKSDGSPVLPSNGHLGVTCPKAAAEWGGVAASVWPLGGEAYDDGVHFAWFESGGEFWPRPAAGAVASDNVIVDGIDCGRLSLDDALAGDRWEVLFRADRGFLAVPVAFEAELREGFRSSFLV
mmetsp:Transcript_16533/g.47594  ORF Transcript_16533/g.47594 Transcript_16533/m.47594 type:complete len:334 (-) Transcript_16533:375-1376(-)